MMQFFYVKILFGFDKIWITNNPKMFDSPLSSVKKVSWVFQLGSRSDVTSSPTQIPLCAAVNIEITCSNACRNARILSIEIIFSLMKSGKLVDLYKRKKIYLKENFGVSGTLSWHPWGMTDTVSLCTWVLPYLEDLVCMHVILMTK